MALPDEPKRTPSYPPPFSEQSDTEIVESFKRNPVAFAKKIVRQPQQLGHFWQVLENHFPNDQALVSAYDKAQNILGKIPPAPQPQPAPSVATTPPVVTAEQLTGQEAAVPRKEISPENADPLEQYLNNFKPGLDRYLAEKKVEAAASQNIYNRNLLEYLAMYRTGLSHFLLTEGAHEMLFSALGPVGDLLRFGNKKNIQWQMAWMKNPLNANAVYYYLNSLPTQEAFKIALLPVKTALAVFTHGGGPLFTKAVYREQDQRRKDYGQVKQKFFFSPALRLSQASAMIADGLDKITGIPTDYAGENKYFENTSEKFKQALDTLKSAKTKEERQAAGIRIKNLLNQHDGKFLASVFRPFLRNLSRRWRKTSEDPLIGLFSLLAGTIIDAIIGTVVNLAKTVVTKTINAIPGVNTLRARLTEFFNSNRYLNTARMGGATVSSFGRGLFSPTTLSSGYLGYRLGSILFPGNPMAVAWTTGITGGLGVFYNTALKMASNPTSLNWIYRYNELLFKSTSIDLSVAEQNYWRGQLEKEFLRVDARVAHFRPGPFSNFAKWLYENPYARLPINGFVVGDILSPFMEARYGWDPWATRITFAGADYLWQTRGAWGEALGKYVWQPIVKAWVKPVWNIFGQSFYSPHWRWFSLKNPFSLSSKIYHRFFYTKLVIPGGTIVPVARPLLHALKNFWSRVQPYAQTVFNPGFFIGAQFLGQFFMAAGVPWGAAHILGAFAGSAGWIAGTHALAGVTGIPYARFASMFNPLAFTGFFVGQLTGLAFFGWNIPFWYTAAWTLGVPLIGMPFSIIASMAGISVPTLLGNIIAGITSNAISALAATSAVSAAMAVWATVISVALVAGLTIFFAYTIYAGFWVPMIEESTAGPQSSNFLISGACTQTGPNQYNCCSNFRVTQPTFSSENILMHETDIGGTELSVDVSDPEKTIQATRDSTRLDYNQDYYHTLQLNSDQFGSNNDPTYPVITGSDNPAFILTALSVPPGGLQTLKELMAVNQSVVYSMKPFFDILTALAKEHTGTKHLVAEYQAQLKLFETQKELVDALINNISAGSLSQALQAANRYLNRNPLTDPCPGETDCPPEKQGLKSLYDSWEPKITRYITAITNLLAQTDPNLDNFLAQLEQEQAGLKQQIEFLPGIIDQMKEIQKKMTDADAAIINDPNFSFYNFSDEVWRLLSTYFKDIFNENDKFYFIPQGTNYRVCMDMTYTGTLPAEEQTVCSTISYQPSIWGPNTSFAKACTTFTPQ